MKLQNKWLLKAKAYLAADESSGTIKKRFDTINVNSSEENRMNYQKNFI